MPKLHPLRTIQVGELVVCPACGLYHTVHGDDNGNDSMLFVSCASTSKTLIVGMNGHPFVDQETMERFNRLEKTWWQRFQRGDTST